MAVLVTKGNAEEAEAWISASALSDDDQRHLLRFVRRFPEIEFFKQTLGGQPPTWFRQKAEALAGVMRGQLVWVQFDAFDHPLAHVPLPDTWYRLAMQAEVDDAHPKVFLADKQVYFVGVEMDRYSTMLAVVFAEDNATVYEFDYNNVYPNADEREDDPDVDTDRAYPNDGFGHVDPLTVHAAFDSYSSMFGHIVAIRLQDGRVFTARD